MTEFKKKINEFLQQEENEGIYDLISEIYNFPLIGHLTEENENGSINHNSEMEYEEVDCDNFDIDIWDNYATIIMSGDWQPSTTFDIILIDNNSFLKERTDKLFAAINIKTNEF